MHQRRLAGALGQTLQLLKKVGHQVDLLTAKDWELTAQPLPAGLRVHELLGPDRKAAGTKPDSSSPLARKLQVFTDLKRAVHCAKALQPDLVHVHDVSHAALLYLRAFRHLGIPVVSTVHNVLPHETAWFHGAVWRRIHALPDLLIAHSAVDQKRLQRESEQLSPIRARVLLGERLEVRGLTLDRPGYPQE